MRKRIDLSLYLVLDPHLCQALGMVETARRAVAGGVTAVQLRHKTASTGEMVAIGSELKDMLAGRPVALVINDDCEAARALKADALHIGQDDMPVAEARRRIGPDMILGLSVETPALAKDVDADMVDYVGAGPVFATQVKPDHKPAFGIGGLAEIVTATAVPVVAIGGLQRTHAKPVLAAGAAGLAVVSAICGTNDPEAEARAFHAAIQSARQR